MPHKHGTNLGGIRTLEDLKNRCVVDEETGCWQWPGAMRKGAPRVHYVDPSTGLRRVGNGRRVALILTGMKIPTKKVVYARECCTSDNCCNPDHARVGTKAAWGKALSKSGKVKFLPSKFAGAKKGWDTRGRKITPDMLNEIRHSDLPDTELAKKLGISRYGLWTARVGLTHRNLAPGASVFTWRPPQDQRRAA